MSSLKQWERAVLRFMLTSKLAQLHGDEFEDFFHAVMSARYPDFVGVRAHGNIGDLSADGLTLFDGKLYACYGAEVDDPKGVGSKVKSDLSGALRTRKGQFGTFVFVHNNRRGVHPKVSLALTEARSAHPSLKFENFGWYRFHNELCRLERWEVEDLVSQFPAQPVVTGVVLNDLIPLLGHLAEHRQPSPDLASAPPPSVEKMDYNAFSEDMKHRMRGALPYVRLVETYYERRSDPTERTEVAAGFRDYYQHIVTLYDHPDEVLDELLCHILGNAAASYARQLNALVVLMYFFGECEIFEVPPPGWSHTSSTSSKVVT